MKPQKLQFFTNCDGESLRLPGCPDRASLSQVYFQCGAGESSGAADPLDVSGWSSSRALPPSATSRSVSSCIDVPLRSDVFSVSTSSCSQRRRPEEVDMDELMAAMVLSSLSCSPLLNSPADKDTAGTATQKPPRLQENPFRFCERDVVQNRTVNPEQQCLCVSAPPMDCGGSELSDSGSSGYWSVGHANRSPSPSPPMVEPDVGMATPPDDGLNMEMDQVLFDEPAPRKRKVSES